MNALLQSNITCETRDTLIESLMERCEWHRDESFFVGHSEFLPRVFALVEASGACDHSVTPSTVRSLLTQPGHVLETRMQQLPFLLQLALTLELARVAPSLTWTEHVRVLTLTLATWLADTADTESQLLQSLVHVPVECPMSLTSDSVLRLVLPALQRLCQLASAGDLVRASDQQSQHSFADVLALLCACDLRLKKTQTATQLFLQCLSEKYGTERDLADSIVRECSQEAARLLLRKLHLVYTTRGADSRVRQAARVAHNALAHHLQSSDLDP
ncbi:MAG: hypothetical protein MHM6MM_005959 [Cercozoa sp. M6MM]